MKRAIVTSAVLGSLMVLAAGASQVMTPTVYMADSRPKANLESIIPAAFGDWKQQSVQAAMIINPEQAAALSQIYVESLARTYVNGKGDLVMLSIAYGKDQRRGNDVHYPEVCYPAQGFELMSQRQGVITTAQGAIAVSRLETNLSKQRYEPVTYWTTIGDDVSLGGSSKRMKELSYGLQGIIPDGLIFRVSSIDRDSPHAYAIQDAFVDSLVSTLNPADKKRLTGLQ